MTLKAKPIVKNKFWIVEADGEPVATIQASPDGVVLVKDQLREKFPSFKILSAKYNIKVDRGHAAPTAPRTIYDFPVDSKSYNEIYDVRRRLPFYTKTAKSKSFFCAGYYAVCINNQWSEHFCPKAITLNRYQYLGPFASKEQAQQAIASQ
jgi:hypothetical protein